MIRWIKQQLARRARFLRFFLTVILAYLVYIAVYWLLSRWIWPHGNLEVENILAIVIGDTFNFFLNRQWTFRAKGSYARHIRRFFLVAGSSLLLQAALFWVGRMVFQIYDLILVVSLPILRALYNYFLHKIYTFREHTEPGPSML